ncbi:CHAT domain-containing protein [Nodularia harveyana UHCC-0300]|uniref:CHAT domain-containing protein n=1 Tax=Nodularia harveyana UHCC-0300 TaxID=2974287 RepID=A0ABU5UE95_9CYAN|nr:CHAT domain-containing protein [Nodularia harveyana]MEA5581842.1 CHAT domain-containing protein [Nodularia harveyana UHCC-0300]
MLCLAPLPMKKQRQEAYLNLIQSLLSFRPNEKKIQEILAANQELLDADFLQVLEVVAEVKSESGQENIANWLRNLAMKECRDRAYFNLIESLLNCGNDDEILGTLIANQELIDAGFFRAVEIMAQIYSQNGHESTAIWLRNLAASQYRHQEYSKLIQSLLNCGSDDEASKTLAENEELIDAGFFRAVEIMAQIFSQNGEENIANWLQNLAMRLKKSQFLSEVLQAVANNSDDLETIYPLLEKNIDKLDGMLAEILLSLGTSIKKMELDIAKSHASCIVEYSNLMQKFPLGDKASNIEIAIAGYEAALQVHTREASPEGWATAQDHLASAYNERIKGDRTENIEKAIAAHTAALTVRTREALPEDWAVTQNNLANAYCNRIKGDRAENIEKAIAAATAALTIRTKEALPEDWAITQNNLANAYCERIQGDRAENFEKAIAAYTAILSVRTQEALPEGWAKAQNNLAAAYYERIKGDRADNIEKTIVAATAALTVFTRKTSPQAWAKTQNNLANAYSDRIKGDRADNIEKAIAAYTAALTVTTREALPLDWAMTQHNIGRAYNLRIKGDSADNIEKAIAAYDAALTIYTKDALPLDWAITQNNLAGVYRDRMKGDKAENIEKAITCSQNALEFMTYDAFPQKYGEALFGLGIAYQNVNQLNLAHNAFESVIATIESLREEIVSGEESKRKQAEHSSEVYRRMVEVCLELGKKTEAIEHVERSKTRNLVEQILERDSRTIFPPDVVTKLETYRDEIATGQYQIQNGKAENSQVLAQHLQKLRQQRNELQNRYLPVGYGFKFDSFQRTLDDRTAILEWYILDDKILAFIVTQTGEVKVWQSSTEDREAFLNWGNKYLRNYYTQKDQWQNSLGEELKELASVLHIDKILTQIPKHCDKLILIPHLFLHLFPLHTIPVNQNSENSSCLLDLFPGGVSYAPSCQLLQQVQKRERPDFQSLFAIQNPTEDLDFTDLEVETILSYFPSHQVLTKKQATKAALSQAERQLKQANYLHFSCHGSFNFNSPQSSCLILADAYVSPEFADIDPNRYVKISKYKAVDLTECLTLGNLFERTLDFSQTRLVVLSACETGLIDFNNTSDEYIGLPSGFIYAGSSSVVSSLWTVNDLSTSFLMIKFIQILQNATEISVPLAMNKAQQWLRDATKEELQEWTSQLPLNPLQQIQLMLWFNDKEENSQPFKSPFHWAAFTATGN